MPVVRKHHTENYTIMSNYHFKDKRLSLKAKGLLSLMFSLPEDWDYSVAGLSKLSSDGTASVRTALKELEEYNYLYRQRVYVDGKVDDIEYHIFECNEDFQSYINTKEDLRLENLILENVRLENRLQLNTNINKKTKNNKKTKDVRQKSKLFETSSKDMYQIFLDMFYENCPSFGKVTKLTPSRKRNILKLFKNYSKEDILTVLQKCEKSEFLLDNRKKWAKLDWIIKEDNFIKILEGNYDSSYKTSILDAPNNKGVKTRRASKEQEQETVKMLAQMKERGEQIEY